VLIALFCCTLLVQYLDCSTLILQPGVMRLLCHFEEEFGEDNWSKLTEQLALDMSVVALASFSGTEYIISSSLFNLYYFSCAITNYSGLNYSFCRR
jgi:hypothetical protein